MPRPHLPHVDSPRNRGRDYRTPVIRKTVDGLVHYVNQGIELAGLAVQMVGDLELFRKRRDRKNTRLFTCRGGW